MNQLGWPPAIPVSYFSQPFQLPVQYSSNLRSIAWLTDTVSRHCGISGVFFGPIISFDVLSCGGTAP